MVAHILAILCLAATDQGIKYWITAHLHPGEHAPLLPGFVELYYVRNTGGGFSILSGYTGLLTIITFAIMVVLAWLLLKRRFPHPLAMWTLTLLLGGGLGNLVDRIRLGYVVDMFHFQFINYPVFNMADICIVIGVIGFAAYYVFWHDKVMCQEESANEKANADRPL